MNADPALPPLSKILYGGMEPKKSQKFIGVQGPLAAEMGEIIVAVLTADVY